MKKLLLLVLLLSGCAAAPAPKRPDPMRIVEGCKVERHIRTHHVSVILMHRCTYWKRIILVVVKSANRRVAMSDAKEIVEGELGRVELHRIGATRIQPRSETISYPVLVLGYGPRLKKRKNIPSALDSSP